MHMLIQNPQQYIVDFLNPNKQQDLQIAIEIMLCEQTMQPNYLNHIGMDEETDLMCREQLLYVQEQYPECFEDRGGGHCKIKPLYILFVLHQLNKMDVPFNIKDWLAELYLTNQLKSKVAYKLIERHYFLQTIYHQNQATIARQVTGTDYHKLLAAITLQHRELYSLEVERYQCHKDYDAYHNFYEEIQPAIQMLVQRREYQEVYACSN